MRVDKGAGSSLPRFFLKTALSLLLLTGAWWLVADWAALPAAWATKVAMPVLFSDLARQVDVGPQMTELETRFRPDRSQLPSGQMLPSGVEAAVVVEVRPAKYGYSLPLLLALLVSGSRRHLVRRFALGAACLVPFQAFSVMMVLLKQAAHDAGPGVTAQLGWGQWQLELVSYGYQLGVLMVPTLSPILLWLWLDRQFMAAVLIEAWLRSVPVQDKPSS